MDSCRSKTGEVVDCPLFQLRGEVEQMECQFPLPTELRGEDATGPRNGLAAGVPGQYDLVRATPYAPQPPGPDRANQHGLFAKRRRTGAPPSRVRLLAERHINRPVLLVSLGDVQEPEGFARTVEQLMYPRSGHI